MALWKTDSVMLACPLTLTDLHRLGTFLLGSKKAAEEEPERPEAHIFTVGAVRSPKCHLCMGMSQEEDTRLEAIGKFDWLSALSVIMCELLKDASKRHR